jgi:hypothetical protein
MAQPLPWAERPQFNCGSVRNLKLQENGHEGI